MSLPTAYLTSTKNLPDILASMQAAQAPKKFTQSFLEGLGFKSTSDRLVIGVLKAVGLLSPTGEPTPRYYEFLDQTQSARVLADGVREAYADLFQINTKAYDLSNLEIKNKLKTLTQGQFSDSVLEKMAATFKAVSGQADFAPAAPSLDATPGAVSAAIEEDDSDEERPPKVRLGGLVYNIQIQLPESRDQAVYDALFRSLKEHLLK